MNSSICLEEINLMLKKKVSALNAKILLESAIAGSGLQATAQDPLTREQVESLCINLINKGGPSFQVGKEVYSRYIQ